MSFSPASPITGAAVTGLTSPTYTITLDTAPKVTGKQFAVTGLGGTQTGVVSHSVSNPFTLTYFRPAAFRALPPVGVNGRLPSVPKNEHVLIFRKGMIPLAGQPAEPATVRITLAIPAGADVADANSIRALLSLIGGVLSGSASGIVDTILTGVLS